ncbi:RNA polymerase sigma factor [Williamwhitmania taraxaci]|uniref:RNA polymerase sigma-70 factor, ECF subfamily n=1 Tax=Williamwhitmania taraxaci TaxID=1640674 RepID=A0A1G6HAW7_9BACT|nr:sigma-70 family RNA polymerase sigma factor [Williamwhitmania taraxaci]SDB91422.1 RNA polymerase sigma-70 factor, ECF subfamily [Williamwhitmania taraxaci]
MKEREKVFKELISDNEHKIRRVCSYYAHSEEDRKDLYQEILINVWKSFETFRGDSAVGTWLYRVALNTALGFSGKEFKRLRFNVDFDSTRLNNLGCEDKASDAMVLEHKFALLQNRMNQLSVIDKAIISLVMEGLPMREIADVIGLTEPNVRVKVHRIKESLREDLKGGDYDC